MRELIQESAIYQELLEEAHAGVIPEFRGKVRQEVLQEIREEIRQEILEEFRQSQVNLTLRQLERCLKQAVPSTAETQIRLLDLEQLFLLREALMDFASLTDLEAWLALQASYQELQEEVREKVKQFEANLILRQLARRLKQVVPSATETQVRSLNLNLLETLGEALLDFTSLADLEEWLRLRVRGLGQ